MPEKVNNYLVSIITPTYNSVNTLLDVFNSVNSQTYDNWEWIVVDDCSNDSTVELLKSLSYSDKRIRVYVNQTNHGAGVSRNVGISKAKGQFIAFLDSDDLWHPEKLHKQIRFMTDNNIALSYTQYQKFDSTGDLGVVIPPDTVTYEQLLFSNVIGCLTAIYDVKQLGKKYMPTIRKRQDMGLWLIILKQVPKAYCLQENLAKYRVDTGMTRNKFSVLKYQWQFYRKVVGLNIFRSAYTFLVYAYKGYKKSFI